MTSTPIPDHKMGVTEQGYERISAALCRLRHRHRRERGMSCGHQWGMPAGDEARAIGFGVAALRYASWGYAVVPCERGGKKPHRMLPPQGGVHWASTDPAQIREWWSQDPAASIGVATGQVSALAVIDLDVKASGHDGKVSLGDWLRSWGMPSAPAGRRRGQHPERRHAHLAAVRASRCPRGRASCRAWTSRAMAAGDRAAIRAAGDAHGAGRRTGRAGAGAVHLDDRVPVLTAAGARLAGRLAGVGPCLSCENRAADAPVPTSLSW